MDNQQLKELKALQEENARLKRMFADLSLDHRILKDIIEKKL
jgi:putative transposase